MNRHIFVITSALVIGLTLSGCVADSTLKRGYTENFDAKVTERVEINPDS